jgi:hypothetical protein
MQLRNLGLDSGFAVCDRAPEWRNDPERPEIYIARG